MKLWEYKIVVGATETLNELGLEGWELVTIFAGHFYFKRPLTDPAPRLPHRASDALAAETAAATPTPAARPKPNIKPRTSTINR